MIKTSHSLRKKIAIFFVLKEKGHHELLSRVTGQQLKTTNEGNQKVLSTSSTKQLTNITHLDILKSIPKSPLQKTLLKRIKLAFVLHSE